MQLNSTYPQVEGQEKRLTFHQEHSAPLLENRKDNRFWRQKILDK